MENEKVLYQDKTPETLLQYFENNTVEFSVRREEDDFERDEFRERDQGLYKFILRITNLSELDKEFLKRFEEIVYEAYNDNQVCRKHRKFLTIDFQDFKEIFNEVIDSETLSSFQKIYFLAAIDSNNFKGYSQEVLLEILQTFIEKPVIEGYYDWTHYNTIYALLPNTEGRNHEYLEIISALKNWNFPHIGYNLFLELLEFVSNDDYSPDSVFEHELNNRDIQEYDIRKSMNWGELYIALSWLYYSSSRRRGYVCYTPKRFWNILGSKIFMNNSLAKKDKEYLIDNRLTINTERLRRPFKKVTKEEISEIEKEKRFTGFCFPWENQPTVEENFEQNEDFVSLFANIESMDLLEKHGPNFTKLIEIYKKDERLWDQDIISVSAPNEEKGGSLNFKIIQVGNTIGWKEFLKFMEWWYRRGVIAKYDKKRDELNKFKYEADEKALKKFLKYALGKKKFNKAVTEVKFAKHILKIRKNRDRVVNTIACW